MLWSNCADVIRYEQERIVNGPRLRRTSVNLNLRSATSRNQSHTTRNSFDVVVRRRTQLELESALEIMESDSHATNHAYACGTSLDTFVGQDVAE
jgi:hypothetical protein